MKTYLRNPLALLTLLTLLAALFAAPPARAQTYKTNDLTLPFTTVTAGVASNTVAFGVSGGWTTATPYEIKSQDWVNYPWTMTVNFSCPTVTLAAATFVFGFGVDGSNFENIPGRTLAVSSGTTVASGNPTNLTVTFNSSDTNFVGSARQAPRLPYVTLLGATNGNAAPITINRVTIRERY